MIRLVGSTGRFVGASFALAAATLVAVPAAWSVPPQAVQLDRTGPDQLEVRWSSPDPVDVLVADRPGASLRSYRLVSPRDRDGHEALTESGGRRSYVMLRNVRTGERVRIAERVLPLEAGSNFRDIGGYPAAGRRTVRWGMIYRSGASPMLTARDLERIHALGLVNLIDLRSDEERVLAPTRIDHVPYTAVGYSMGQMGVAGGMEGVYRDFPRFLAPQLKQVFAKLLRGEQPLAYNCSAGQDRTGFVTAMILSALGTPRATIIEDYHLSTRYRHPEFEMPHIDLAAHPGDPAAALFARYQDDPRSLQPQPLMTADGTPYLAFAFAEIEAKWGTVDSYLIREVGLTRKDIARLRILYTE
jgi:protein-tyrosine phosphatase